MAKAKLEIKLNQPLQIVEEVPQQSIQVCEDDQVRHPIGALLKSYLKASKELLEGKYSEVRNLAPLHMTDACQPFVFIFEDGILVRYDRKDNPDLKLFVLPMLQKSVSEWAPRLSDFFVHCPEQVEGFDPGEQFVTLEFFQTSADGDRVSGSTYTQRIAAVVSAAALRSDLADQRNKPVEPVVTFRNEFSISVHGELLGAGEQSGQLFVTNSTVRMQFGWEAIELFSSHNEQNWDPTISSLRAERDLLAAIAARNMRDGHFHSLDPRAAARRRCAQLFSEWEGLMLGAEEPLHQFLKQHPELLSPVHSRMWSKLRLGERVTDFVFREPAGDYVLVELEKPSHRLFGNDGQPLQALNHAVNQTTDWLRYLEDNLQTVRCELGLHGISSSPRCLIVIGRSKSLTDLNRRKLLTIENRTPRLKIMTYDDLFANSKAAFENILGLMWDAGPNVQVFFPPAPQPIQL